MLHQNEGVTKTIYVLQELQEKQGHTGRVMLQPA